MTERRPEIMFFPRPPGYVDPHDGPGYLRSKVFELEGAEALDVALRVPSPADEQSVIESEVLVSTDKEEWLVLTHTTTAQAATLMEQLRVGGWRFVRAVLRWSGDGARMPLMVGFLDPRT